MPGVWRAKIDQQAGYIFNFSEAINVTEKAFPGILDSVSNGRMLIASDYSGQHKEARHESYSFLVSTTSEIDRWLPLLKEFRETWLPDGRRISYKKIKEPVRWRALPSFLDVAGKLKGNLITIMVDQRVGSFMAGGPAAAVEVFPECFPSNTSHGTVEKMLRLVSFISLIIAGLRDERQPSIWLSDHDETLDSYDRRENLARLASYLSFGLTGWRNPADNYFATTETSNIPSWSEDVAAIPDLAAGAYCQLAAFLPTSFGRLPSEVVVNAEMENQRAAIIGNWLADASKTLKHILLRAEVERGGEVRVTAQVFKGMRPISYLGQK